MPSSNVTLGNLNHKYIESSLKNLVKLSEQTKFSTNKNTIKVDLNENFTKDASNINVNKAKTQKFVINTNHRKNTNDDDSSNVLNTQESNSDQKNKKNNESIVYEIDPDCKEEVEDEYFKKLRLLKAKEIRMKEEEEKRREIIQEKLRKQAEQENYVRSKVFDPDRVALNYLGEIIDVKKVVMTEANDYIPTRINIKGKN